MRVQRNSKLPRRSRTCRNNRGSIVPPIPKVIVVTHKVEAPQTERHWQLVDESDNCSDCDDNFGPTKVTSSTTARDAQSNKSAEPIQRYPLEAISRLESIHNIDLDEFRNVHRDSDGSDNEDTESLMGDLGDAQEFAYTADIPEVTETPACGGMGQLYEVEVTPGVFKTLHGADYTQRCLERGRCIQTMCLVCDIHLACVDDCEGVICPQCFSISPVQGTVTGGAGYIGIGLDLK